MLNVQSIFKSIQGEGQLIGLPTLFIRLAGCPLQCAWCDTVEARSSTSGKRMEVADVIEEVEKTRLINVCLTGGEPLAQKESITLVNKLVDKGYFVQLETSGALPLEEAPCSENVLISMDIKCPSSGMHEKMLMDNIALLSPFDQLKFVIADDDDYQYAKKILAKYKPNCSVIMTPVGGTDLEHFAKRILRDRLNVRILPQLHKLIWSDPKDK